MLRREIFLLSIASDADDVPGAMAAMLARFFGMRVRSVVKIALMARLSSEKLQRLKKAFTENGMLPGQAATQVGVTYATAKRYYDLWGDEIQRTLESRLIPALQESVKRHAKKPDKAKRQTESKRSPSGIRSKTGGVG